MTMMNSTWPAKRRGRMLGMFVGVGLAYWLTAAPASAQWFGGFEADTPIPPQGIVRMLTGRGFSEITRPRFDGEVYRVEGINRFGERVRLTVDAYDGDIVERRRLAHADELLEERLVPPQNVGPQRSMGRSRSDVEEPFAPPAAEVQKPRTATLGDPAVQPSPRPEPPVRNPAAPRSSRPAEARPVQPHVAPPASAPVVAAPKPRAPTTSKPMETATAPPSGPVRVIGGVTPLNPNQVGAAKPASPEPSAAVPETPPL